MSSPDPAPDTRTPFIRAYDRLLFACDTVVGYIVTVAMGVLSAVLVAQVFYRYVLNDSLDWGNDVPRLAFIAVIFLSIPLAFRFNAHVGMDFDLTKVPFISKPALNRFNAVAMLVLFGLVGFYGLGLMERTWDQMMPGLDAPVGLFYLCLTVGQIHCCLHVGRTLITGELPTEHFAE